MTQIAQPDQKDSVRKGFILGISCYAMWGLLPLYFKSMSTVSPYEIVAQRVVWSAIFMMMIVLFQGELASLISHMRNRRLMSVLTVTSVLIALNWLIYVWAVANDHILAASLGYFLNPLVNVALGVMVLKEKLRRGQMVAIGFALVGVVILAFSALNTLWISVLLALSFGIYGLLRKMTPVAGTHGLTIETLVLTPFAVVYLLFLGQNGTLHFGDELGVTTLLVLAGVVTSVPLLCFNYAAQRLPLATLGVMQYLAPSIQFLMGVLMYKEPLDDQKLMSFMLIWAGLIIFTHDALKGLRAQAAARRTA
ncbi:MAG: EamA family transporter RarD [Sphingobium sp.]|nr:EamA family transporter RarD [Sphingobium sp.]